MHNSYIETYAVNNHNRQRAEMSPISSLLKYDTNDDDDDNDSNGDNNDDQ